MRPSGRATDQLRDIVLEPGFAKYAEGSCMARFGETHVLCAATVEERVPGWMRDSGKGWVTAEYNMLPGSTSPRKQRDRRKVDGRTTEIQRLIGRSLRAAIDLKSLGERTITIDCDVIQADGGTRTAAITGAWVALRIACEHLLLAGAITQLPLTGQVAAISCGVYQEQAVLDLDYEEDSSAEIDANFILTAAGELVEVQATGEEHPFSRSSLDEMLDLAEFGCGQLFALQQRAIQDSGL